MSDKARTAKPGEGMTRDQLVRAHFEAYSDLVWKESLEPKFLQYDLDADAVREYRQQWNAHTEKRDWAWWQDHAKNSSNEKLMAEIDECMQEIKAIDRRRSPQDSAQTQSAFQAILSDDNLGSDRSPELAPARTQSREM